MVNSSDPRMGVRRPSRKRGWEAVGPELTPSVHPRLGLYVGDVVAHRVGVYRAAVETDGPRRVVEPGQGVLHPVRVIAGREILAGVGAAAFGAVGRAGHGDDG